jgi:hypothetical protein
VGIRFVKDLIPLQTQSSFWATETVLEDAHATKSACIFSIPLATETLAAQSSARVRGECRPEAFAQRMNECVRASKPKKGNGNMKMHGLKGRMMMKETRCLRPPLFMEKLALRLLVRASITLLFCVRGCIFQLFDKHF